MSMDLHHIIDAKPALDLVEIKTNDTFFGVGENSTEYESFELIVHSGIILDGDYAITMYEANLFDHSDETLIESEDFIFDSYASIGFTLGENNVVKRIGFITAKKYFRMKIVSTNVTSGGFLSAVYIRGNAHNNPTVGNLPPIA